MKFLTELSARWTASAPTFFKKIQSLGNWLTASGLGLIGVPAAANTMIGTDIDLSLMVKIASYMIVAGLAITAVAKLPVRDTDQIKS